MKSTRLFLSLLVFLLSSSALQAQVIADEALVAALQEGGLVIVMRHASSPRELPDEATANPDNVGPERQLDETGRRNAAAMGIAFEQLMIPVAEVLSSPTYRAMETAMMMGLSDIVSVDELSNEGMRDAGEAKAEWLRQQVAQGMEAGNRLLITHAPNVRAAFADAAADMEEGEALVFDPNGTDGPVLLKRVKITQWPEL